MDLIRIKNETPNFYSFLFTDNSKKQMECLSTGTLLSEFNCKKR